MPRLTIALLSIALLACEATAPPAKLPSGPGGDVAREVLAILAPNAQIVDLPFEHVIATLDLAKPYGSRAALILDQVRETRGAVEARARSSASHGPRLASSTPAVGNFAFAEFAKRFGEQLDARTRIGGTQSGPASPHSSTKSGADTTTTTTLSVTETFTGQGSVVTATVRWSYTTITIDTSPSGNGATLLHLTDDRDFLGTIDVCPDASGGVRASLKVTAKIVATRAGETTTRISDGNSSFKGSVNDQASLVNVSQQSIVQTSTETSTGRTGYGATTAATWNNGSTGFLGNLAEGSFKASFDLSGGESAANAAKAAGWDSALGAFAVEPAYLQARDLWQKGRCVVVAVDEYKAETPVKTEEQQRSQHDEEVDVSSETKFVVQLRHRFQGGGINKPTNAELISGKEKLSPNKLESGGGQLTYKAADEDDKEARTQLRSTSNRGIGTLVLTFRTGGKNLTLSVQGVQELGPAAAMLRSTVTIGPAKFQKKDDKTWEASAPFSATSALVPPQSDCPNLKITQSGTLTLTATVEQRGDSRFWVVRQGLGGSSTTTGSGCDEEVTKAFAAGGAFGAGLFLANVGDIVIPIDGGTIPLQGSQGTGRASGTATATVTKRG